ncbi:MAG TPA: hypothetical protein VN877_01015 [Opitutaceae bacterium]|nr:hypothetical protein [Opitutaceae bacterium]
MKRPRTSLRFLIAIVCLAAAGRAQGQGKGPASKLFIAETNGETQIDTGKEIDDLTKKSVYRAQGTVVETKPNSNVSLVLSNGTGIYVDVNTRLEIRGFQQEPFRPNRTDMDDEPSVSKTHLYLDYGVIGVSTSNLVAGSTMTYETSLSTSTIRGRQAVILAGDNITEISMIAGDATVQGGPLDSPHEIQAGQQIIIQPGKPGGPNIVLIQGIAAGNAEEAQQWLEYRVLTADDARKLVYFEVQARKDGSVTVFDGASPPDSGNNEIVAVPVVPVNPPVQPTVSAANLNSR